MGAASYIRMSDDRKHASIKPKDGQFKTFSLTPTLGV